MLLTEPALPLSMEIYQIDAIEDRRRSLSTDSHHCRSPHARSTSSYSSSSSNARLRLADVAKQYGMGVHVDNWREDMHPIRQYLPMQHIIGSLKRDRDEQVQFIDFNGASLQGPRNFQRQSDIMAASPRSEDSFLQMLRTPKRRRTSDCSQSDSNYTTSTDPDRRFSYQAAAHIAKDLPQSALPGLNHILNLSTITADERDIFTEYAPKYLEDSQILMTEVLQLREKMMNDEDVESEGGDDIHIGSIVDAASPVIPPERDAEVRKALEDFVEFHRHEKYIAKI